MKIWRSLDFETSGWPPHASVIEVGYTDIIDKEDGSPIMLGPTKSVLCRPDQNISIEAMAVHHITHDDLLGAPYHQDVLEELERDSRRLIGFQGFVAHNAKFEQKFFSPVNLRWGCTMKISQVLWPQSPKHTNQVLRYFLQLELDKERAMPPHRAGPDTYVTAHIFIQALDMMPWEQMMKITGEPTLLTVCTFGKYKGKAWADVPSDYMRWILSNTNYNDESVKHTAQHWLSQRSGGIPVGQVKP